MKIVTIIGARPQFIKAAPFSKKFRLKHTEIIIHTGQHYDFNMSDVFFEELDIPKPNYNLGIGSYTHGKQTGKMLESIEDIILKEEPDGVLVYGDTNSTLAGALAASKLHIPVYHIESGLRSYNKLMPEEQNRILTDHISSKLFCPTKTAVNNLYKENIKNNVFYSGDIMYDALLGNVNLANSKFSGYNILDNLSQLKNNVNIISSSQYYLATIHRAENTNDIDKLILIFKVFEELDKPVLIPLHPRTKKLIANLNLKNTIIVEPVGYLLMLYLVSNAYMIITDSGGLQKEAFFLKVPCTTLRDETEWIETLIDDWNVLSNINVDEIKQKVSRKLTCLDKKQGNYFGDGNATQNIYNEIINEG